MATRLQVYIARKRVGGFGWLSKWRHEIASDENGRVNYAYLSGVYSSMLDDLIAAIGMGRAERLADLYAEMDPHDLRCRRESDDLPPASRRPSCAVWIAVMWFFAFGFLLGWFAHMLFGVGR